MKKILIAILLILMLGLVGCIDDYIEYKEAIVVDKYVSDTDKLTQIVPPIKKHEYCVVVKLVDYEIEKTLTFTDINTYNIYELDQIVTITILHSDLEAKE